MRFTFDDMYEFFNSLLEGIDFITERIIDVFYVIFSHPMLATIFFTFSVITIVYMLWEFIIWASDIKHSKNSLTDIGLSEIKKSKRNKISAERDVKNEQRFLANYELRSDYYNAMLMNKAAQLQENQDYHSNMFNENKRYHDELLKQKGIKASSDTSFDIDKAKERSRDTTRDIGTLKRRTPRSVRAENEVD